MELTKKQRREIYLKAHEDLMNRGSDWIGLCPIMASNIGMEHTMMKFQELLELMPEFRLFKPERNECFELWWFSKKSNNYNIGCRLTCMLLCAEMCK